MQCRDISNLRHPDVRVSIFVFALLLSAVCVCGPRGGKRARMVTSAEVYKMCMMVDHRVRESRGREEVREGAYAN